jgi:hypothetical protein
MALSVFSANAASVKDCGDDFKANIQNLAEPWEKNTKTFLNGSVRIALVDTGGEPVCCSMHLLVLAEAPEDPSGPPSRICKIVSNTAVGKVGQTFVESLCEAIGLPFTVPIDGAGRRLNQSPWDIAILGKQFELKTATEDVSRCFQFNHIRYHRPYDAAIFIGVAPEQIFFDAWSKADLVTGKAGKLVSMEAGANASYKFSRRPAQLHPITDFETRIRALVATL